jgi:hypothetical protein
MPSQVSVFKRVTLVSHTPLPQQQRLAPSLNRLYASAARTTSKKFELPEEHTDEVFRALANNPSIMEAMHNVIEACNARGIALDREPSISDMWKIMKDKDVMAALNKCT